MIEKIRAVQNPLTVIAIFAALAEVASTVALATVDKDLQHTFVWFVMAFPSALVLLFFLTLNFNPTVLYAPSDFANEENFLKTLAGKEELSVSFRNVGYQLEVAQTQIVAEAEKKIGVAGEKEGKRLAEIVNQQMELIRKQVESARESAEDVTNEAILNSLLPRSSLQASILDVLRASGEPVSADVIVSVIGMSRPAVDRALEKLAKRGTIVATATDGASQPTRYALFRA
jgi:hypothetical protein